MNQELAQEHIEWLVAAGAGDRSAFEQLYRATSPKLFGLCLQMVRRREVAEDVLQDAYVQIWRKASGYSPDRGAPMAWMSVIVRHRALDWLRRNRDVGLGSRVPDPIDETHGPQTLAALMAKTSALNLCFEALADEQRLAIGLSFYRGLSHGEVSERIPAPLGTVKSWIRRGMDQLRRCLEK